MILTIVIILLGLTVVFITIFMVRSIVAPKRLGSIADLIKQNRNTAAIKATKKILVKEPRNPDAHYLLGLAYLGENKQELALMELQTVNQIGQFDGLTKEVPFRTKIAELYEKFNQPEEALKEYLILIKKEPSNPEHFFKAGKLFENRNKSGRAASFYKKAVEMDPRNGDAHMRLGSLYYRAKKYAEARSELEAAVKFKTDSGEAFYYLGKIQKEAKEFVPALASFEKASRDGAFKVKALIERGGCYLNMNNIESAIPELERAVKLSDNESSQETLFARYFLAASYEKTRKIDRAVQEWEKIYARKPGFRDVAEKLTQYQELRTDDRIKDFLTCGNEEFLETCDKIIQSMGLQIRDSRLINDGCEIIAVEGQSKWRNARKMPKMIRFYRVTDNIDESTVRSLHEEMKKQNITRGVIVTSTAFARSAIEFAESRPIDLHNKDKLQELLQSTDG
jgi:tetratricopeptide (TPR) repeat protein